MYVNEHTLDLSHKNLNDHDLTAVMKFLFYHPNIDSVDLSFNQLGPSAGKLFAQANRLVTRLSFYSNNLGDEGLRDFCQYNSVVKKVDFSSNNITCLSAFVALNKCITYADFSWNSAITDNEAKKLFQDGLLRKLNITNLNLSYRFLNTLHAFNQVRASKEESTGSTFTNLEIKYSQNTLLKKINIYLAQASRDLISIGYCSGITALWLYKMAEGKEDWFYDTVKKIVHCDVDDLLDMHMDIEKFLAHIEWAQNVTEYHYRNGTTLAPASQQALDKILEVEKVIHQRKDFTPESFKYLLSRYTHEGSMIRLSAHHHAIGVYRRGLYFYCFDSNYHSGKPTVYLQSDSLALFKEVNRILYAKHGPLNPNRMNYLTLVIVRKDRPHPTRFFKQPQKGANECIAPSPQYEAVIPK